MKIVVGVLFGGQSAEHDISIRSSKFVIEHLDCSKYDLLPIGIDKQGEWFFFNGEKFRSSIAQGHIPLFCKENPNFPLIFRAFTEKELLLAPSALRKMVDLIFPVLHGPYGEDGSLQGLMQLANIPYVGSAVLSSAICMDKIVMKNLLKSAALPVVRYLSLHCADSIDVDTIVAKLKLPLFVKPANLGSSVGISKIRTKKEFLSCVHQAFLYDEHVIIEECIEGREFECSILGNFDLIVSPPGEIIPSHEFYSYTAKYLDPDGAIFEVPAQIDLPTIEKMQHLAARAYKVLRCEGMARVDFFLRQSGEVVINELNTIPGFTAISLYPRLLQLSGITPSELIDRLIHCAIDRFEKRAALRTTLQAEGDVTIFPSQSTHCDRCLDKQNLGL